MKQFVLFFCAALLFSGCVKNNAKPVFLQLNKWTLEYNTEPDASDPGVLTQNFTDAWVYVDEKLVGVFELPCKIPVLTSSGSKVIRIYPTVRNNGISATKKIYPFVQPYEVTMNLEEGQTYTLDLKTRYYAYTVFHYIEDFEPPSNGSITTNTDESSGDNTMTIENNASISQNGYYGHVHLTSDAPNWVGYTEQMMSLPKSGAEVYLEIDYMNTNDCITGVLAISNTTGVTQNPYIRLNKQDAATMQWKKMYIDLKEIVSYSTTANYFEMYFQTALNSGLTSSDIYIDNIKVIHF